MERISPLIEQHRAYLDRLAEAPDAQALASRPGAARGRRIAPPELETLPYRPPSTGTSVEDAASLDESIMCEIVATFSEVEPEYAAIRRGAGLMDSPQRGTLIMTGSERQDFLNRMVTQELKDLKPGAVRQTFLVNRKGRIDADLAVCALDDRLLLDVDIHQAAPVARALESFLFAEDVEITDASADWHRLAVHGPSAIDVMRGAGELPSFELEPHAAATLTIAACDVVAARWDETGAPGVHLFVRRNDAPAVWAALLAVDESVSGGRRRVRPIGWYAYNIARIEGGTPLFNIDFGSTNLPHETGMLHQRVSFTKGCYPGQEVVARMQNLGKPKQQLVGLRIEGDALPVSGAQIFAVQTDGTMGDQVGMVTSSTLSPLRGAAPVAFAMLRTQAATAGGRVLVNAEGQQVMAVVQNLRFLPESD